MKDKLFFTPFKNSLDDLVLPEKFTFPFYYDPHPIAIKAAKELQDHIQTQTDWSHNFGLPENDLTLQDGIPIGKMFGVLVVKNAQGKVGYLSAFSGKLAESNHHKGFVPPVYDMLVAGDFFQKGGDEIISINQQIEILENEPRFLKARSIFEGQILAAKESLSKQKQFLKTNKKNRKTRRESGRKRLNTMAFEELQELLKSESLREQYFYKKDLAAWDDFLRILKQQLSEFSNRIEHLKKARKEKSKALQNRLFSEYKFLNKNKEEKSLLDIFQALGQSKPPAGAGECAAPKLLQCAFVNDLTPIALAEFWWGLPPSADVKKHRHFYPACKGKCEPILNHMLKGMTMDENPLLIDTGKEKKIDILHEDEDILVINKPPELLSVPGKGNLDSVYARIQAKYPNASGPLIVHRLDMSTSGLMVIPLNKKAHEFLQKQFIKKSVKKRYVALLDGYLKKEKGQINLPLRVDLDDRPRQLVCHEHGKIAHTEYKVIERKLGKTKVYFYPLTGRTHQLRVHAAHEKGLNLPIVGDDLYGKKSTRLHLHAERIAFLHPKTQKKVIFNIKEDF